MADRRREVILEVLRAGGSATVGDLAGRLGLSAPTIRRDLLRMDADGLLRRVHGGAVPVDSRDDPFAEVAMLDSGLKYAIAVAAAATIADGETVILDIGTTVAALAKLLHGRDITVITSSLAVYDELRDERLLQLVLLGGTLRPEYHSLVGFLTEDCLRQVHADQLFMGTSGVRPTGEVMDTTVVEVPIKRAMIAASDRVTLLADAHKFPGSGVARVCGPGALNELITTDGADPATLRSLADAGAAVRVV